MRSWSPRLRSACPEATTASPTIIISSGASVHWNTFLNQYVMLLNHASDSDWYQEGVYVSYAPRLDDPRLWSVPAKLLDGGNRYPQVMGLEIGTGTDKVAGERARFFMSGVSQYLIHFTR